MVFRPPSPCDWLNGIDVSKIYLLKGSVGLWVTLKTSLAYLSNSPASLFFDFCWIPKECIIFLVGTEVVGVVSASISLVSSIRSFSWSSDTSVSQLATLNSTLCSHSSPVSIDSVKSITCGGLMISSADVKDAFISSHFSDCPGQDVEPFNALLGTRRAKWVWVPKVYSGIPHWPRPREHYVYLSRSSCPKFRGKLSVIILTNRLVHIRIVRCYACPENISQSHNFQNTTVIKVFCHVGNVLETRLVIIRACRCFPDVAAVVCHHFIYGSATQFSCITTVST